MKIYDLNKREILTDCDMTAGYLKEDKLYVATHPEQEAVEEQFHYEVEREYAGGGKDVKKIIDVEAIPYRAAYDEYEDIYVYVPYTEEELNLRRIEQLKLKLAETDYVASKLSEALARYVTLGDNSEVCRLYLEYEEVLESRRAWRNEIDGLQDA